MFDRETVRKILAECEEALRPVAERHGIELLRKHCTFSHNELPVAFRLVAKGEDGALTREAEEFTRYAKLVGLEPSMLGAAFRHADREFKVVGLNLRARSFPVIAQDERGKRFKFDAETVKALIGVQTAVGGAA